MDSEDGHEAPRRRLHPWLAPAAWNAAALAVSAWMVVEAELDGRIVVLSSVLWIVGRIGLLALAQRLDRSGAKDAARFLVREAERHEVAVMHPTHEHTGRSIGLRGYLFSLGVCALFVLQCGQFCRDAAARA